MKRINKIVGLFSLSLFIFTPVALQARENVTNWYIQDFQSEIRVKSDSTLLITEDITADCGNATGKHGIFRVLPTQLKTTNKIITMPVRLVSITDFSGKKIPYSTIKENNTITWKIGDKDKTVTGVNKYRIVYEVGNVINMDNPKWDELYWNLTGNFWDIEIDKFTAKIIFPEGINKNNTQIQYYTGRLGENKKDAEYSWIGENILEFLSSKTLRVGDGITLSVTFPKNIFALYEFSFWEKYQKQISFGIGMIVFLISFFVAFLFWKKYGKDPRVDKTIIAEFEVPENLAPIEMGILMNNGGFKNEFITASLVNLAVKGVIRIEEIEKEGLEKISMLGQKNIQLTLVDKQKMEESNPIEKMLIKYMLKKNDSVKLHDLRERTHSIISAVKEEAIGDLVEKKLINEDGLTFKNIFIVISIIFFVISFIFFEFLFSIGLALSGVVFLIFSFIMPKRTSRGAEINWKIEGFKLYMETAEKYRQQFYEKENIFEKLLPYAIVFGMAKLWAKKMEEIYGPDYFKNYHSTWYVGAGSSFESFDASSFASSLNSISTGIGSNISSGSGSGGSGGSGGGGGGGGGGGW